MPELPEVETIRSRLEPLLVGRSFDTVEIRDARLTRPEDPARIAAELERERVAGVDRRGKYLIIRFESGVVLLIHLRMTGSVTHALNGLAAAHPHQRAVITLDNGSSVLYRDVRRFGTWTLLDIDELEPYLAARLGCEPLARGFTSRRLGERLSGRRAPIKAALLDQRTLAGLGNIYVDEALWRARIHPSTPSNQLGREELAALHRAIRLALRTGISRQGATLRDYRTPEGGRGRMQHAFKVYGREGQPCEHCGTPIEKTRAGGRGTWFCPGCQPGAAVR